MTEGPWPAGPACLMLVGSGKNDVYLLHGRLELAGQAWTFHGKPGQAIPMEYEWITRAKSVPDQLRDVFGPEAQVFIKLSLGDAPNHDTSFQTTGFNVGID
jgi:hypothetical protein